MQSAPLRKLLTAFFVALLIVAVVSCAPDWRWCLFDGNCGGSSTVAGNVFLNNARGGAFTEVLIQERTFVEGRVVTTVTHRTDDMTRSPILLDFNGDGKVDPVVGYNQQNIGLIQILLSYGEPGEVSYGSLTLDGGDAMWTECLDVAAADIDGDGRLDLVAATQDGVIYLRHPSGDNRTHVLPDWGAETGELERIEGTTTTVSEDEVEQIIANVLGGAGNAENYIVTVDQGYTSTETADYDNDGDNDIAASRSMRILLTPKPDVPVEAIEVVAGSIQILLNPGGARTGEGWSSMLVGYHERHNVLDRDGARDLRACDLDDDGDLDLISTATDDQNVQVAWFENPGGPGALDPQVDWPQHRIGSVRGAFSVDVADLTGDDRVDVVVTSPTQMQIVLFVQPSEVSRRAYDWYTVPIVTFENFEPRSIKAIDVDNDDLLELVIGGTGGAVRYFEPPLVPTDEWTGQVILTFDPPGNVGLLGYGDLDGDGDADLVAVVDTSDVNASRLSWIRNELIP